MKSVKYLEQVQNKYELKNDAALAEKLKITRSAISLYKSGQRVMDEDTCLKVAVALKLDNPMSVLMAAGMDRSKKAGQKSSWGYFSRKLSKAG
ncbi:Cro/Cl family transcriptional regulator [Herminiimonas glaciei]|uniref:Cro/Cl family transcriptional regulator n=1 Tax=Herminiimonas glaciei TaxID=523788 RepID=A0ABW2I8Y9_9BURK